MTCSLPTNVHDRVRSAGRVLVSADVVPFRSVLRITAPVEVADWRSWCIVPRVPATRKKTVANGGRSRGRGSTSGTAAANRPKTPLGSIPGIGKTFTRDFARIGITSVEELGGSDPEALYARLGLTNESEGHSTSKNYLYVIRMAVYYANGGRDVAKLRWSEWSDEKLTRERRR